MSAPTLLCHWGILGKTGKGLQQNFSLKIPLKGTDNKPKSLVLQAALSPCHETDWFYLYLQSTHKGITLTDCVTVQQAFLTPQNEAHPVPTQRSTRAEQKKISLLTFPKKCMLYSFTVIYKSCVCTWVLMSCVAICSFSLHQSTSASGCFIFCYNDSQGVPSTERSVRDFSSSDIVYVYTYLTTENNCIWYSGKAT